MKNKFLIILLATVCIVAVIVYVAFAPSATNATTTASVAANNKGDGASANVIINEAMASNSGAIVDDVGLYSDWVEIFNAGDTEVNLSGWGFTDTPSEGAKYVFPNHVLQPKEYLVLYCSGTKSNDYHANFKLKAGEETVQLQDSTGAVKDTLALVVVPENNSIGRKADNMDEWAEMQLPTPGFANSDAGRAEYEKTLVGVNPGIRINELQPSNKTTIADNSGAFSDWIEIYNTTDQEIDLSGFGLSDDKLKPIKWRIPEGTKIDPRGYLLIFADGGASIMESGELHCSFKLSSYEETVMLSDAKGRIIQTVDYKEIPTDATAAFDEATGDFKVVTTATPGEPNTEEGFRRHLEKTAFNAGDLYISEVMLVNKSYLPEKVGKVNEFYDWIELHNTTGGDVDLTGYALSDNSANPGKWRFPEGSVIKNGGYLVVLASGTGKSSENYLHTNFKMSNGGGETLSFWSKDGQLLDKLICSQQFDEASYGRDKNKNAAFFAKPTPGEQNGTGYKGYAPQPVISLAAGLYAGNQSASIEAAEGTKAYYTLDGRPPDANDEKASGSVAISKTTVLRARAYQDGYLPSRVATATYFIDSPHNNQLSLVSLSTDPKLMFDETIGMYSMGPDAETKHPYKGANFWDEIEIPAHVEIFSPDGTLDLSQDITTRIFGAYSRGREQKGLALIADSTQGEPRLMAPIFKDRDYQDYSSLVLRASGQDSTVTKLRDIVATSLVDGTNDGKTLLQTQAYRQAVVYINGEYFGIYNIREKINKYWIEQHYGVNPENIDLLVGSGTALRGDNTDYKELIKYCQDNNLKDQKAYDYVASKVDVANYIDYIISEMYIANTDTGNIKWFRERKEGGKYIWIYYDFCWSLSNAAMNSIEYLTDPKGHGVGKGFSTQLTRSLMQNVGFRNQFIDRCSVLFATIFAPANVLATIEKCEAVIADEKPRDSIKWPEGGNANGWKANVNHSKKFAKTRIDYLVYHLRNYFNLSADQAKQLFGTAGIAPPPE